MCKSKFDMNVPIPAQRGADKYRLEGFPLNGSRFIPLTADLPKYFYQNIHSLLKKKNPGAKFITRSVVEEGKSGIRIWRTE